MGRISDIMPLLYFSGKNDLKKFLDALDVQVDEIEQKIKALPTLIDVDACPDDKLPYLAALTGCTLVGDNAVLRRRQIRNWPHLLKLKGTEKSLKLYLESIGATQHKIMTYFRDAEGNYVENKPDGEPFQDEYGLWYNVRTHYFGLEITWDNHEYLRWPQWNEDLSERMAFWMKNFKPFHAELLKWDNLIYEQSHLNFSVGTAIFQSPYHVITYNQATESGAKFFINFNAGLFSSKFQSVIPALNDNAQSKLNLKTAAGLFGAKMQNIKTALNDKAHGYFYFRTATGLFSSKTHNIKIALNDKSDGNLILKTSTGLFNARTQKIKPALNTTGMSGAALSTGGANFCSKFYTVKSRI